MCGSGLKRCHPRGGEDLLDCSKRILTRACPEPVERVRMTNTFLTPHNSQLTTHNSQLTTHTSHLTPHTSQLTTHHSQLITHNSSLTPSLLSLILYIVQHK